MVACMYISVQLFYSLLHNYTGSTKCDYKLSSLQCCPLSAVVGRAIVHGRRTGCIGMEWLVAFCSLVAARSWQCSDLCMSVALLPLHSQCGTKMVSLDVHFIPIYIFISFHHSHIFSTLCTHMLNSSCYISHFWRIIIMYNMYIVLANVMFFIIISVLLHFTGILLVSRRYLE